MKNKIKALQSRLREFSDKNPKGFTLLEMIVAVALFGIISVFTVGSYIAVSSLQRTTSLKNDIVSEERFVLDTIGREITWAVAIPDCPAPSGGCTKMRFAAQPRSDSVLRTIEYKYDTNPASPTYQNVLKAQTKPLGSPCEIAPAVGDTKNPYDDVDFDPACQQKVFSDAIKISDFRFFTANNEDNVKQVVVTAIIKGTVVINGRIEPFSLSSTFTPRIPQNTLLLNGGGVPVAPTAKYMYFLHCPTTGENLTISWPDVNNAADYHVYVCAGTGCDPRLPADGGTGMEFAVIGDDNRSSNYKARYFGVSTYPLPTDFSMTIRAHEHVGLQFSPYSNVLTRTRSVVTPIGVCSGGPSLPGPNPPPGNNGGGGGGGEN
jgi:prepilin-type N-terminal cleavage/methylation domain-containing protein